MMRGIIEYLIHFEKEQREKENEEMKVVLIEANNRDTNQKGPELPLLSR